MTIELASDENFYQEEYNNLVTNAQTPDKNVSYKATATLLNAADYQALHAKTVADIIEYQEYIVDLRIACTELYELCDDEYPDDCIPEFTELNYKRSEMRRVREQLNYLHRINKYFKTMSRVASY